MKGLRAHARAAHIRREKNTMTTMLMEQLRSGDVIEVKTVASHDDVITVLVLLATDDFVILDPCDDSTPFVVRADELIEYRKFDVADVLGIS
ncbi:hypothetical protein YM304_28280 [Ilumatobacter coccineus YM16-304]|uniref:Uncharacterized protein n=2 Tax=Ilumatobacter coccineus TaxID=467094 RepID=A0A6C7EAV6_ILUCY|nr:hypothetical protein YM304_28280 [Ilumatobacter coccineus YM16-304]